MLMEIYKIWISFCTAIGVIVGFFGPFIIAAYIIYTSVFNAS